MIIPGISYGRILVFLFFSLMSAKSPAQENFLTPVVYHFPGAVYAEKNGVNLLTDSIVAGMREIVGEDNVFLIGSAHHRSFANVSWALRKGQKPVRNPGRDARIRSAYQFITNTPDFYRKDLILTSTSYGSVVAAQTTILFLQRMKEAGISVHPVNLVLGYSMLSKSSRLFRRLEELQAEGRVGMIIYDELQDPDDNVTGMCKNKRLAAFVQAFRMACICGGTYQEQPSILNCDPETGHIHRQHENSSECAGKYLSVVFVEKEIAGREIMRKAQECLVRKP